MFAGFTHDLQNPDDFVVAEVGGRSVAVQNFMRDSEGGRARRYSWACHRPWGRVC